MSEIRYYTDEHVSSAVINGLRQRGVDVQTVAEARMLSADDEAHLAFALGEGRVIFTQDADFLRLAGCGHVHAGIVYASQQSTVSDIIRGLVLIFHVLTAEEITGNIEFL